MWSVTLPIAAGWKKQVAETCGVIMKQADKHPRCRRCGKFLVIRRRGSDRGQFFGCPGFPGCSGSASIGTYEVGVPESNRSYQTESSTAHMNTSPS
jgi:ssDNA-binding Zn-finger/Zn-ribbon topoisomerase 1